MANTMTYVTAIDFALQVLNENSFDGIEEEKVAVMDKLEALKAQLEKRNSRERKPTKAQLANADLKGDILAFVGDAGAVRAMDVAGKFEISGQKASALLKQLVDSGLVEKYAEKRVTYFKAVEE